jgi:hypothetical protein
MNAIAIQRSRRLQARNFLDRDRPPTSKLTTSAAIAQHMAQPMHRRRSRMLARESGR